MLLGSMTRLPLLAVAIIHPAMASAAGRNSCFDPDALDSGEQGMRESLGYSEDFPNSEQHCRACAFFTPDAEGVCGSCSILHGSVSPEGHCSSWAARK